MTNSIYDKNRTYYYKFNNGTIYECKLVSVRLAFHDTKMSELISAKGEKEGIYLDQIIIHYYWDDGNPVDEYDDLTCELYDMEYDTFSIWREGKQGGFEPTRLYSTEGNAINEISPLFVRKNGRICLNYDIEFPPTPKNSFWKKNNGWLSKKYNLATYRTNGDIKNIKYYGQCIYIEGKIEEEDGWKRAKEEVYYENKWKSREYKEDIDAINKLCNRIIKDGHFNEVKEWIPTQDNNWPCFDLIPYKWFIDTVWNSDNSFFATQEEAEIARNKANKKNKVVNKGTANKRIKLPTKRLQEKEKRWNKA